MIENRKIKVKWMLKLAIQINIIMKNLLVQEFRKHQDF